MPTGHAVVWDFYNIQVTIDGIEAGKSRLLVNLG